MTIKKWGDKTYKECTEMINASYLAGNKTQIEIYCKDANDGSVTLNENDIDADNGITVTTILNPDIDITFGKAVSSEVVMHIIKNSKTETVDWSKTIRIEIGVEADGATRWSQLIVLNGGTYKTVMNNGYATYVFTGYDYMTKLDVSADDFVAGLTFPTYTTNLVSAIGSYLGVSIGFNIPGFRSHQMTKNPFSNGYTMRDILSIIAESLGGYVVCYNGNYFDIRSYRRPPQNIEYTITPDSYFELNKDNFEVSSVPAVVSIDTSNSNNTISYPSSYSGTPYKIYNNPIFNCVSQSDAEDFLAFIKDNLLTFTSPNDSYTPMNITTFGNPMVEVGDIIDVTDIDNNTYPMRIFSRVFTWKGSCEDYYECTGNYERSETSPDGTETAYNDGRYVTKTEVNEPTRITPTIDTSKWTIDSLDCYALGSIVFASFRVTSKTSIYGSSGITIPAPINNGGLTGNSGLVYASNNRNTRITVIPDGSLYAAETIATNTFYVFTFAYVSTVNYVKSFIV